jgi:hypothetical protein
MALITYLLFALCPLPSALCSLPSTLRPLLNEQNAIRADGDTAGAERAKQLFFIAAKNAVAIVEENEIVAGGRELGKTDAHR